MPATLCHFLLGAASVFLFFRPFLKQCHTSNIQNARPSSLQETPTGLQVVPAPCCSTAHLLSVCLRVRRAVQAGQVPKRLKASLISSSTQDVRVNNESALKNNNFLAKNILPQVFYYS